MPRNPEPYVIDDIQPQGNEEGKMRHNSLHPVELEAIAKISKVTYELNKVLMDQGYESIYLEWSAMYDGQEIATANPDFPETVEFS